MPRPPASHAPRNACSRPRTSLVQRQTEVMRRDLEGMYECQRWPRDGEVAARKHAIGVMLRVCSRAENATKTRKRPCDLGLLLCAHEASWRGVCVLAIAMYDRFVEFCSAEPPSLANDVRLRGISHACVWFATMHMRTAVGDTRAFAQYQTLVYETLVCNLGPDERNRAPTSSELDLVALMARSQHECAAPGAAPEIVEYVAIFLRFWAPPTLLPPVDLVDLAWEMCGAQEPLSQDGMVDALHGFRDSMSTLYLCAGREAAPPVHDILRKFWTYKLAGVRSVPANNAESPLLADDLHALHTALAAALCAQPAAAKH